MDLWAIILLAIDLSLMGGALFIILRRNKAHKASAPQNTLAVQSTPLVIELKNELAAVRALAAELHKKKSEMDDYEKGLRERHKKFEGIISHAEAAAKNIELLYLDRKTDDSYARAIKMLKTGKSSDEIVKSLGLPDGEVELLSSISNYRI